MAGEATVPLRTRHAIRCAVGAVVVSVLAHTSATTGCLSGILFLLATVAGTPEPYLGFQIRSTVYTFLGAVLAALSGLAILQAVALSQLGAFFLTLPFIAFYTLLRIDNSLAPLPLVANAFTGYFVIMEIQSTRSRILQDAGHLVLDAALACGIALAVNIVYPDLAGSCGRNALAMELRNTGAGLSTAASRILAAVHDSQQPQDAPLQECAFGRLEETRARPTENHPELASFGSYAVSRQLPGDDAFGPSHSPVVNELLPPGVGKADNYAAITRAEQLLAISSYEPGLCCPRLSFRQKDLRQWQRLVDATRDLVTKVSSLESVAHLAGNIGKCLFSRQLIENLLGHAYIPLWLTHFSASAAACNVAADQINARSIGRQVSVLHDNLDAAGCNWLTRRAQMYFGFLLQYRLFWRRLGLSEDQVANVLSTSVPCRTIEYFDPLNNEKKSVGLGRPHRTYESRTDSSKMEAIVFMSVTSHAFSEALARVQATILEINQTETKRSAFAPLFFLNDVLPPLGRRVFALLRGNLKPWETRFAVAHSAMLALVLAICVLVNGLEKFGLSQIAWVYVSAALVAQVRAEPTAFISTLRLSATVVGAFFGFGIATGLQNLPAHNMIFVFPALIGVLTVSTLLIFPPRFRYAAFLFLGTFMLIVFCPRANNGCSGGSRVLPSTCRPDLRFTLLRSICVSIGIVFALAFHVLFWPRFAQRDARVALSNVFVNSARLFTLLHRTYLEHGQHSDKKDRGEQGAVVRVQWHRGRTSIVDEHRILLSTVTEQDVMRDCANLVEMAKDLVGRHMSMALEATSDAKIWPWSGPFRMPPLLHTLPGMFAVLSIALSEMASILGRRPILSGLAHYGRSAHSLYVSPLVFEYETMLVSIHNVVSIAERCILRRKDLISTEDLNSALSHLNLTMHRLRAGIAGLRWKLHARDSAHSRRVAHHNRRRQTTGQLARGGSAPSLSVLHEEQTVTPPAFRRSHSMDVSSLYEDPSLPAIDDIVLYNAFQYASNSCVVSFIQIAEVIIDDLAPEQVALDEASASKNR